MREKSYKSAQNPDSTKRDRPLGDSADPFSRDFFIQKHEPELNTAFNKGWKDDGEARKE